MSVPPEVLHVVGQWIEKAEEDFVVAERLLIGESPRLAEIVCFHAQQCVEKYMKGILALHDIDPPKTHDIEALTAQLAEPQVSHLSMVEQRRLTKYPIVTYPGTHESISREEAREAVEIARRARSALQGLLPPEALEACR